MGQHEGDEEPTHALPKELQDKLVEAKEWYDRREELEEVIRRCVGIAQRNEADRDALRGEAELILAEVVEIIDRTWGFA
jgi:hypothetical protein